MARRLITHLGLPKAASTALQLLLSARAAEIGYLGRYHDAATKKAAPFRDPALRNTIRMAVTLYDARTIDTEPARRAIHELAAHFGTDILTLSDEGLSSAGFGHRGAARGMAQILVNLEVMGGLPVTPVLVLREQRSFLRSYHTQLVLGGYRLDFSEFVAFVLQRKYSWLHPVLDYSRFCGTARLVCDTVHVTAMERITNDDSARADFLSGVFGIDFSGLPFPVRRPRHDPAETLQRLLANRRMQGQLDRTIAEVVEGRFIRSESHRAAEALAGPLESLANRQTAAIRHWSEQTVLTTRQPVGDAADHPLLRLSPGLDRVLQDRIRDWNAGLPALAPDVPWRNLGYLL